MVEGEVDVKLKKCLGVSWWPSWGRSKGRSPQEQRAGQPTSTLLEQIRPRARGSWQHLLGSAMCYYSCPDISHTSIHYRHQLQRQGFHSISLSAKTRPDCCRPHSPGTADLGEHITTVYPLGTRTQCFLSEWLQQVKFTTFQELYISAYHKPPWQACPLSECQIWHQQKQPVPHVIWSRG